MKKKLFVMYCEDSHGEYELWFKEKELSELSDEKLKCVGGYFCNDANWRSEYFNDIFQSVDVIIKTLKYNKKTADEARRFLFGN